MTTSTVWFLVQDIYNPDTDEFREEVRYDLGWFPTQSRVQAKRDELNAQLKVAYTTWHESIIGDAYLETWTFEDYVNFHEYDSVYRIVAVDREDLVCVTDHLQIMSGSSAEPWQHDGHNPVQHRDAKPPWCHECGWTSPTAAAPARLASQINKEHC